MTGRSLLGPGGADDDPAPSVPRRPDPPREGRHDYDPAHHPDPPGDAPRGEDPRRNDSPGDLDPRGGGHPNGVPVTMRAAYVDRLGPAEHIRVGELVVPAPAPDEVLVRVEAVAVNPVDTYIRSGRYRTPLPGFPFVVGRDLVGVVETCGVAADAFAPGQRVWTNGLGYAGRQGATAEYAVVPADRLYPLPDGLDPVRSVALFHPAVTAYLGLFRHVGGVGPGDTVVVGGAAGNVGSCVSQLAAFAGARVVALARTEDATWCRNHGATAVVDYRVEDLRDRLAAEAPGGATVWFDTSGRIDLALAVEVMADRGAVVLVAGRPEPAALPIAPFYLKSLRLLGYVITTASAAELADAARVVGAHLAEGRLDVRIGEVLPLDQAARAHQLVEHRVRGRVILVPRT
ncbi:NADPH:quinone reductase [Actinopolymorpha sp. NPDC004070]|uniref:NADPH:quinone reductase n=1 Tax=Actinopolymorpha sp. NPDC004070 TaxID=3154548 RepID=UPI0033B84AD5